MTRRKDPMPVQEAAPTEDTAPMADPVETASQPEEPTPPPDPAPASVPPPGRNGILWPLLGGAIAAVGGFAVSHFNLLGLAPATDQAEVLALSRTLEDLRQEQTAGQQGLSGDLSALVERVAALEAADPPAPLDAGRLQSLEDRLAAIEALPADGTAAAPALAARLADLDRRVSALGDGGVASDLKQDLDAALERLGAAEAEATARAAEARAAEAAAARQSALEDLRAAVQSGEPFAEALAAIADPALTAALQPLSATGVPSLAALQADFPDAAREALRLARETDAEDGWGDRLVDFLADQTGARSVAPREGTDPDAILSRAEFALSEGRPADALAELQGLDPALRTPLDAWTTAAETHLAAQRALLAAEGE